MATISSCLLETPEATKKYINIAQYDNIFFIKFYSFINPPLTVISELLSLSLKLYIISLSMLAFLKTSLTRLEGGYKTWGLTGATKTG